MAENRRTPEPGWQEEATTQLPLHTLHRWHKGEVRRHGKEQWAAGGTGTPCPLELGLKSRPGEQRRRQVCVQARPRPVEGPESRVQHSTGGSFN